MSGPLRANLRPLTQCTMLPSCLKNKGDVLLKAFKAKHTDKR